MRKCQNKKNTEKVLIFYRTLILAFFRPDKKLHSFKSCIDLKCRKLEKQISNLLWHFTSDKIKLINFVNKIKKKA